MKSTSYCRLPYMCMCICIYIYRAFFGLQFMFVQKYIFDIEQIWVQFPAANSAFWKVFCILSCCPGVLFKKGICPDWTCNSSKDKLTTHECRPFACIIYMLPSKGCLVEKKRHLQGNNIFCMTAQLKLETYTSRLLYPNQFLRRSCILNRHTFCSELCTVSLWTSKIQVHIWKIYCMLCTIAASFKGDNGL